MRVALLPTGRTEWRGLPGALRRLFPGDSNLEFFVLPTASEVLSNPDGFPYPGFTSNALTVADEVSPPESAMELVGRAAQAALGDRHVEPADLVVVLDDLELANAGQADRVCRVFRAAVTQHLAKLGSGAVEARTRSALVQRVSFHLLVPMVEALFFADEGALRAAGVPEGRHVEFTSERDPEAFVTADPEYRLATADDCPCWHQLPQERRQQVLRKKKLRPKWIEGRREVHPKGYLQWLCRDGALPACTRYDETVGGGQALAGIGWAEVLGRPAAQLQFLRAFVADVADALDQAPGVGSIHDPQAAETSRFTSRPRPVLRNL
jgi:hypothetical protein